MRITIICLALGLVVSCLSAASQADVILVKSNNTGGSFNGSTGQRTVSFDTSEFFGSTNRSIKEIEIAISFTKLKGTTTSPKYNEISFSLSKAELATANLINPSVTGTVNGGSFTQGFSSDLGFDGTIVFKHTATNFVNINVNKPVAGEFKTVCTGVNALSAFCRGDAAGTYTLKNGDNNGVSAPLVFNSFTLTVLAVPEPSSLACLGLLAPACAFVRRRRNR